MTGERQLTKSPTKGLRKFRCENRVGNRWPMS
jgi:hypothetical protein